MPLLTIIIVLVVIGALMWAINVKASFLTAGWKTAINVVVAVVVGIWLLKVLGVWSYLSTIHT